MAADALGLGRVVKGGLRLPALAHPELPISCLPTEKMPSSTSLQHKLRLSPDQTDVLFPRPSLSLGTESERKTAPPDRDGF